jgi:hypothetical protein
MKKEGIIDKKHRMVVRQWKKKRVVWQWHYTSTAVPRVM